MIPLSQADEREPQAPGVGEGVDAGALTSLSVAKNLIIDFPSRLERPYGWGEVTPHAVEAG